MWTLTDYGAWPRAAADPIRERRWLLLRHGWRRQHDVDVWLGPKGARLDVNPFGFSLLESESEIMPPTAYGRQWRARVDPAGYPAHRTFDHEPDQREIVDALIDMASRQMDLWLRTPTRPVDVRAARQLTARVRRVAELLPAGPSADLTSLPPEGGGFPTSR